MEEMTQEQLLKEVNMEEMTQEQLFKVSEFDFIKDDDVNLNVIKLFSIYDKTSKLFGNVFNNTAKDVVIRDLKQIMLKDDTHLYNTKSDNFMLCQLGNFNVVTGELRYKPEFICDLQDIKDKCDNTL